MNHKELEPFGFTGQSPLWDSILLHLNNTMQDDVETAINRETTGEYRIHAAGRAEALNDFLISLQQLRSAALEQNGPIT